MWAKYTWRRLILRSGHFFFYITFVLTFISGCYDGVGNILRFSIGDVVVLNNDIGVETWSPIYCMAPALTDYWMFNDYYNAVVRNDTKELNYLCITKTTINIDCKTHVKITGTEFNRGYKIKVLEGQYAGEEFWIYHELVKWEYEI